MKSTLFFLSTLTTLAACSNYSEKINYDVQVDTVSTIDHTIRDTTKTLIAELPIKFDSIDVLIHAIQLIDLQDKNGYAKSISYRGTDIPSSYFSHDQFTGNYVNLIFEQPSGKRTTLTKSKIRINHVSFLRGVYKKTKKGFLLYTAYDRDTNKDGEFNREDLESLYISKADGTGFAKMSKELHELYDYRILEGNATLYFRTLEDINKDGKFNHKDQFHYYKVDLMHSKLTIQEYNPLDVFKR